MLRVFKNMTIFVQYNPKLSRNVFTASV